MTASAEVRGIVAAIVQSHGGYFTDEEIGSEKGSNLPEFTQPGSGGA